MEGKQKILRLLSQGFVAIAGLFLCIGSLEGDKRYTYVSMVLLSISILFIIVDIFKRPRNKKNTSNEIEE
jgi:TRAP-type C4-dicarboxylate transport system permease small subunit